MRKLLIALVLLAASLAVEAQTPTVSCTVSNLTPKQTTLLASFLANVNATRAAQVPPLAPFANFNAFCADLVTRAVLDFANQQVKVDAAKVGAASEQHGDETAPTGQCTATGQSAGCTKSSVACFALTGNITCS